MIITDKAIYLQVPKTASSRIADLILASVGGTERAKHGRLRRVDLADPVLGAKYVFGSIRSPWEYYVSIWAYGCRQAGGLYEMTTGRPSQDRPPGQRTGMAAQKAVPYDERSRAERRRARQWARTYEDPFDHGAFRQWLEYIHAPSHQVDVGRDWAKSAVSNWAGLLTYRFCWMCLNSCVPGEDHEELGSLELLEAEYPERMMCSGMVRVEHLADDLEAQLRAAGHELSDEAVATLHDKGDRRVRNRSDHDPAADYFDESTRELVARRDAFVLRHFYS